jgi:hypothetical protein
MPGNIAGNHSPKVLSVHSYHCSECLHVIQNETLSEDFYFKNVKKSQDAKIGYYSVYSNTGVCFLAKNRFTKSAL